MTDRSFGLFEPDALLPAQFYAAFRGGSGVRGERRLMLAVLEDALDCFQKYSVARDGHGQPLFDEALAWIDLRRSRMVLLVREHLRDAGDQSRVPAARPGIVAPRAERPAAVGRGAGGGRRTTRHACSSRAERACSAGAV